MKFIDENFLLQTPSARRLYHDVAQDLPIIDYHSHLSPQWIAEDHVFSNLTEIWLSGDHYKWRAMRAAGIPERLITGDASDWDKFQAWAEVVPQTLRNPLYHWTHLELKRPLGIDNLLLDPDTASDVWKRGNALLKTPEFSVRGILRQMNVQLICTTDDPTDSLEFHKRIAQNKSCEIAVFPTFRPDKALNIPSKTPQGSDNPKECVRLYLNYLDTLGHVAGREIREYADLVETLQERHTFFHQHGCRLSDHGFEDFTYDNDWTLSQVEHIFLQIRRGEPVSLPEEDVLRSALMFELGKMNAEKGWTMQLHIGALRNNNTRLFKTLGPDCGCDSMSSPNFAYSLSRFFDALDVQGLLPKTILYNLNPVDNEMFATMLGNFQDGLTPGKMQFGSGWWFLDQKDGMEKQLNALSNLGLLSRFVGMLTDSRSFLSFTRHEYFRRILCNILGTEMEQGLLPPDFDLIAELVRNVCYENAKEYFEFDADFCR